MYWETINTTLLLLYLTSITKPERTACKIRPTNGSSCNKKINNSAMTEVKQVAQLSQRQRAAGWVSCSQKWKTIFCRRYRSVQPVWRNRPAKVRNSAK